MIYLDANAVIRLVEGTPATRAPVEAALLRLNATVVGLVTSALCKIEARCRPMKLGDTVVLGLFDTFFTAPQMKVWPIDDAVVEEATKLRAAHGFKTPDAIHLATAIVAGASAFLTGDAGLARCSSVTVEVV